MDRSCLVSIIVPVCNVQKYLRQCLNSLTYQTLEDIQIICINDGSTDSSLDILREYAGYDPRIEVISKPNAGYGHTMNCGLNAARGEYIGIVESDDWADPDMFESLYGLAKQHNADVVKSDFYYYLTDTDAKNDLPVQNLSACTYNKVFCPLDDQSIFLTQPAIWSALYRRDFLKREGISFLETPGASFQDTSFNFKVFAAARRVVLTEKAYLHYRIDNAASSVKSLSKVFCICDEYQSIWDFARSREDVYSKLKYRIPQIQFGGYLWNLERLTPRLQYRFYERLVEEFQSFDKSGLLREEYFDNAAWDKVQGFLSSPDAYFCANYGPIQIDNTVFVVFGSNAVQDCDRVVKELLKNLKETDEMYLSSSALDSIRIPSIQKIVAENSNVHFSNNDIMNSFSTELNAEEISGEGLIAVFIGGPEWSSRQVSQLIDVAKPMLNSATSTTSFNESWALGKWSTSDLKKLDSPVWLNMLLLGFYDKKNALSSGEKIPEWILGEKETERLVDEQAYVASYRALKKLYVFAVADSDDSFQKRQKIQQVFRKMYNRFYTVYQMFSYEERCRIGKPSPKDFSSWVVSPIRETAKRPLVTIIIPVFNSERYLDECLETVLNQSLNELEIICVDDGSTDGSLDILNRYSEKDNRVIVFSQFNGGAGSARNCGIEHASGEYLAFIDPDDHYPDTHTLEKLYRAAENSKMKIAGGSFVMRYPNGEEKTHFGGDQCFYTFRECGIKSLSALQSDYGWIRFIYHHSIFSEGNIRFPEYRWYEDPVFLIDVMRYCDEFYAITDPVYSYRADYKTPSWNVEKVRDLLKGVYHNTVFAKEKGLGTLYTNMILRLDRDYYDAIRRYVTDEEVFLTLVKIQGNLDSKLFNIAKDNRWSTYLIRLLADFTTRDTAVVRFAKKIEKSHFYKKLQQTREIL